MPKNQNQIGYQKRFKFKKYFNCWIYDQGKKSVKKLKNLSKKTNFRY